MNNDFLTLEECEVNPPVWSDEKREAEGSVALAKQSKKIKTTITDMDIQTTSILAVEINKLRFEIDERFPWITIYQWNEANLTRIDEIDEDFTIEIQTLEQLKVAALNWYFDNVEVVGNL